MADNFQLKALITGVDKLSPTLAGIQKNVASFRKGLEGTGLGKIGFKEALAGGALAAPFVVGAKAAIEFESAMADVRKVVDFDNPGQFKEMGDDITKMSERLPMAANDIAKIVAAGGQSGIARGELLAFAQDAVKMGIAFDQTAEESGDMMAKWRTSFKMTQAQVVGLADKINYLGNTGPANARQISDIVTRVGPLGEVAGVASGQIAAMGATMAGVGVEQEVAATGIKNFMLALTKGGAATKSQAQAFKALRLDSKQVAAGMQKDAQGTMLGVLKRIAAVDAAKRPALLTNLFGSESIAAIAPLLTNLGLLESNLKKTGDATQYAGSMEQEYDARAATTENNLTLLRNGFKRVGMALGNAFLPAINAVLDAIRPLVSKIGDFIRDNPALVQGVAAAGVAFTALRVGIIAATVATKLLSLAMRATPIGIIVSLIAAAVGIIVANWGTIAPFFQRLWGRIIATFAVVWPYTKKLISWTPLAIIIENWEPLKEFFSALWEFIKVAMQVAWEAIKKVAAEAWEGIKKLVAEGWAWIKEQIGFDPVAAVKAKWEPLVAYFKDLFEKIKPYIQPLVDAGNWANGAFDKVGNKANEMFDGAAQWVGNGATKVGDFFSGNNPGALGGSLLSQGTQGLRGATQDLLAGGNKTQLDGALTVRFENAPPGLRTQPAQTNQPGLKINTNVGYRTLSGAP